jgi:hypothetical protein
LLPFEPNKELGPNRKIKTREERNYLTYCLNALFNRGEEIFDVTDPPARLARPGEQPMANLLWRQMMSYLLEMIDPTLPGPKDVTYEGLVRRRCALDPVFFFNGFVYGNDPRLPQESQVTPFILWEQQAYELRRFDECIDKGWDYKLAKSRNEGATYVLFGDIGRRWLFLDESALITTLKADKLDGSVDTVFGKLKDICRRLPTWMLPPKWSWDRSYGYCTTACWSKPVAYPSEIPGKTVWKKGGTELKGQALSENAAVSGRYMTCFFDEFAIYPSDMAQGVWQHSADSARCRAACSSPREEEHYFESLGADDDEIGVMLDRPVVKGFINWRHDPRKNQGKRTIPYRPVDYASEKQKYSILLRMWDLEEAGQQDTAVYLAQRRKCRDLDPKRDAVELAREFSRWLLSELVSRYGSDDDHRYVLNDLYGETERGAGRLFSDAWLKQMPIRDPDVRGDFDDLLDGEPELAEWREGGGSVAVWAPRDEQGKVLERANGRAVIAQEGHWYVLTADTGGGVKGDYSVVHAWDVTDWPIEQRAMFRSNEAGPAATAHYLWALARMLGPNVFVCPERNNQGETMLQVLIHTLRFPVRNVYTKNGETPKDMTEVTKFGWYSQGSGRATIIEQFREEFESEAMPIVIHSEVLRRELESVPLPKVRGDGGPERIEMPAGKHDDCLMAAGLLVPGVTGLYYREFGKWVFSVLGPTVRRRAEMDKEARVRSVARRRDEYRHPNAATVWGRPIRGRKRIAA